MLESRNRIGLVEQPLSVLSRVFRRKQTGEMSFVLEEFRGFRTDCFQQPEYVAVILGGRTLAQIEYGQSVRDADCRVNRAGHSRIPIATLRSEVGGTEELFRLPHENRGLCPVESTRSSRRSQSPLEEKSPK